MKKRDFETYQKRLRDFEILPKFSETHVFRVPFATPIYCKLTYPIKLEASICTVQRYCENMIYLYSAKVL